jgi:hypothetical protein
MAAPHVAGIAALMLQYNPSLTSTEIRSVIVGGAALDGFTGLIEESNGSTVWGWGKADARTATTLYRVVSTLELLPSEYTVSLTLDSVPFCPLRGGEVLTMRFASGTVHTFQVADQIIVANATRYVVTNYQKVFSANGIFGPTVRTQYLLSLESPLGYARGEGWYDSGSCASPTVSPHALATSHSRFLGVVFFFDYWLDERGNRFSSGCLLMDSPHSARAVWVPRLVDWWPILLILTIAASGLLLFEFRRRRLQG